MSKIRCSVVLSTYQRAHLLCRSLVAYEKQAFDNSQFELIVISDGCTDGTRELVLDWSKRAGIAACVLTPSPKPAQWVDCGYNLNWGIRASRGKHVLLTHPEVMPGRRSVAACVERLEQFERDRNDYSPIGCYAACKIYYLSPRDQELLDTVPWQGDEGNLAARQIPGFYDQDANGNPDYRHEVTDKVATPGFRIRTWDSFVFGGHSRATWKKLSGLVPSLRWGSVDIAWNHRRKRLGMEEWTCAEDASIAIHQNHNLTNDVPTDRDMAAWQDECRSMDLNNKLVYPQVNELGWEG